MTRLNVIFIIAVSQMYVEKPIVKKDSYVGDARKKTAHFITRGGFRFKSTERERVQVSYSNLFNSSVVYYIGSLG